MSPGAEIGDSGRAGRFYPASLAAAVLLAGCLPSIPPAWLLAAIALLAAFGLFSSRYRWLALFALACCWSLFNFQTRLNDRLNPELAGTILQLEGTVTSIPFESEDFARFRFRPDPGQYGGEVPALILVHWYRDWPQLSLGEQWQFHLSIKPPWGPVNFQGSDRERWLFAQGIGALGTVREGLRLAAGPGHRYPVQSIRQQVLQRIAEQVPDNRGRAVVQALATAERSGLSVADRKLLAATGTSHLLAISGLHVGLAAVAGFWISRFLLLPFPLLKAGSVAFLFALAGGMLTALAYAALANFGTPTIRAVLMLATVSSALFLRRTIHPWRAWSLSLAFILLADPFAALGAGLWFSFLAVAALLFMFQPRTGRLNWWKTMLLAQSAVALVLLPLGAAWFYSYSPAGFLANLVAIPWVSFLVVPLVLAGLAVMPLPGVFSGLLWSAAGIASTALFHFLELIDHVQGRLSLLPAPSLLQTILALFGAFIMLLPRGLPYRWLGLFLVVPLFFPPAAGRGPGALEAEILDVGQGTAVIVSSGGQSMLYDSGPGDGGDHNLVNGVIAPALARLGPNAPHEVIISHGDLDHAGGLQSLLEQYPNARYRASVPDEAAPVDRCDSSMTWRRPGIEADSLHPSSALPYMGNDSSCVISIGTGNAMLLPGDISRVVEHRLLLEGLSPHRVLLVPHHGSATSSSAAFIERVDPEVAIATAGLGNRFNFPRPEIRGRYQDLGVTFWSTGECGAIRLWLHRDGGLDAISARRARNRIWRWPAGANCP